MSRLGESAKARSATTETSGRVEEILTSKVVRVGRVGLDRVPNNGLPRLGQRTPFEGRRAHRSRTGSPRHPEPEAHPQCRLSRGSHVDPTDRVPIGGEFRRSPRPNVHPAPFGRCDGLSPSLILRHLRTETDAPLRGLWLLTRRSVLIDGTALTRWTSWLGTSRLARL